MAAIRKKVKLNDFLGESSRRSLLSCGIDTREFLRSRQPLKKLAKLHNHSQSIDTTTTTEILQESRNRTEILPVQFSSITTHFTTETKPKPPPLPVYLANLSLGPILLTAPHSCQVLRGGKVVS
jgi:hypothetical protein